MKLDFAEYSEHFLPYERVHDLCFLTIDIYLPFLSSPALSVVHDYDSRMTYCHLFFIPSHFRNDIFYVDIWISLPFTFL